MNHLSKSEQDAVTKIVLKAGAQLLTFWKAENTTGAHLTIIEKPDGTNVTDADLASNETIVSGLQTIFPTDRILSEEIPAAADIDQAERVWIIDPLDGTQWFIEGRNEFSVLVALTVDKRPVFGVSYFPATQSLYLGTDKLGAFKNDQRLSVSKTKTLEQGKTYIRGCTPKTPEIKYPHSMNSGLAFAQIAAGELDGTIIKLNRLKQWDLAAPAALILEAGGKITDEQGKEILYSAHNFKYEYFVASNGHCHGELLKQIVPRPR